MTGSTDVKLTRLASLRDPQNINDCSRDVDSATYCEPSAVDYHLSRALPKERDHDADGRDTEDDEHNPSDRTPFGSIETGYQTRREGSDHASPHDGDEDPAFQGDPVASEGVAHERGAASKDHNGDTSVVKTRQNLGESLGFDITEVENGRAGQVEHGSEDVDDEGHY